MGEQLGPRIAKAEANLAKIGHALYRLRPVYVLVVRIVLANVVSALDYVYEAMPPCPTRLRRTQRAVDRVGTRALRVLRNVPRAFLWMPVTGGGFGFPHLYGRMRLRHVQGYLRAMDSGSVLVRENVRALRHPDHWKGLDSPDWEVLFHAMAEVQPEVHILPAREAQPAAVDNRVHRPYVSGGVLLAADGAMEVTPNGETLGWGALMADSAGVLVCVGDPIAGPPVGGGVGQQAGGVAPGRVAGRRPRGGSICGGRLFLRHPGPGRGRPLPIPLGRPCPRRFR